MMQISDVLENVKSVGISGHIRPDGDCVGSTMSLFLYLTKNHPDLDVHIYLEKTPDIFSCIKDISKIEDAKDVDRVFDLFICVDCDKERLGDAKHLFENAKKTVNIDHHITNTGCADTNYVDADASSASELVFDVLDEKLLDEEIAKALYIGIIHDTGVLQYSNVSPKTLLTVSKLIPFGFDFSKLIDETFYEKTYLQTQIMGRALLESFLLMDGRVSVSQVDRKMMDFYKVEPSDLDGIVNQLRMIKGVDVAIFMYQLTTMEYKVSLRSNGKVDVSKISAYFGGGGHKRAAGVTMEGSFYDVVNNLTGEIEKQYV